MSAPYMQSMFSSLQQNPEQAASMMQGAFSSNPQLQQQVYYLTLKIEKQLKFRIFDFIHANITGLYHYEFCFNDFIWV